MAIAYPTTKDYDQTIAEGFWIADFYTSTCGPCKILDRILNEIVLENPDINWAKCNLENDWSMQDRCVTKGGLVCASAVLHVPDVAGTIKSNPRRSHGGRRWQKTGGEGQWARSISGGSA